MGFPGSTFTGFRPRPRAVGVAQTAAACPRPPDPGWRGARPASAVERAARRAEARGGAGPAGARQEGGLAVGAGRVGEGAESRGWGQREARQAARGGARGGSRKQPGQGSGGDSAAARLQ